MTHVRSAGRVGRARWVIAGALLAIALFGSIDPYSRWVAIGSAVLFVPCALSIVSTLRLHVEIDDEAIALFGLRRPLRVPWDDVTGYRFEQFHETTLWTGVSLHSRARWRLHVESRGNPPIVIDDSYDPAIVEAALPRVHVSLRERGRRKFGAFALIDDGLQHRDRTLAWHEIEDVAIGGEGVVLVHQHARASAWACVPLYDVRCVLLLAELLAEHDVVVKVAGLHVPAPLRAKLEQLAASRPKSARVPVARVVRR